MVIRIGILKFFRLIFEPDFKIRISGRPDIMVAYSNIKIMWLFFIILWKKKEHDQVYGEKNEVNSGALKVIITDFLIQTLFSLVRNYLRLEYFYDNY